MDMDEMTEFRRDTFERFQIGVRARIPDAVTLQDAEMVVQQTADRFVVGLKAWVLAGVHDKPVVTIREYDSWWERFKGEKFPSWLKRRFPPVMREDIIVPNNTVYVCPHANFKWPDTKHIEFMRQTKYTGPNIVDESAPRATQEGE